MGDHFVLLVDRLLTESSLEATIESKTWSLETTPSVSESVTTAFLCHRMDVDIGSSSMKLAECRICHDEDEESNMETPCYCSGTLKFAHRKCIQRWCNEKGDTICEICHQKFKPGYTSSPPLFHYGGIPMNFRGNWEISTRDLNNPGFIAMVASDREFMNPDFGDFSVPTTKSLISCRIVAIIFTVLLVLRHTLPILISGGGDYSFTMFTLLVLGTVGILLPIYIMVKALTAIQRRRPQLDPRNNSLVESDEENSLARLQPLPRLIHVQ